MQYRFDEFALDIDKWELRRNGELVPLEPQVYEVLAYLIANRERLVPKSELLDHVWPEKYISEAALASRLMAARRALGDTGREQRYIRTLHGRGFRFIGDVRETDGAHDRPQESRPMAEGPIRFCTAVDGVRLAYATTGSGPCLLKAANWLTHLEYDTTSPVWQHMWSDLSAVFTLTRYDARGSGLSDWDVSRFSFDAWVDDLEAVANAAGLERFPLLGLSQGGPVAIAFAARHPDRVSKLVLLGAFSRGRLHRGSEFWTDRHAAMRTIMLQGWGKDDVALRQIFSINMIPDGTPEQWRWLTELQRVSASPENALRFHETSGSIDVEALLPQVQAPTLVLHARGDQRVPFEEGRRLATLIPHAQFVSLESRNHLLLGDEPAWPKCRDTMVAFLLS